MEREVLFFLFTLSITIPSIRGIFEDINLTDMVNKINSDSKSTWQADSYGYILINREKLVQTKFGIDLEDISELLKIRNKTSAMESLGPEEKSYIINDYLPISFDARKEYPRCKSIRHIWDQSNCASCSAISASSVLSDRLCIQSKGKNNVLLSIEHVIACNKKNRGCKGGKLRETWEFLQTVGTVTGGDFHSDEGCQPYSICPCGWPNKLPCKPSSLTPKCKNTRCFNEWYDYHHEENVFTAKNFYQVSNTTLGYDINEMLIKKEIHSNGPVQAAFLVYEDFLTYKSGIYQHEDTIVDTPVSGLSVKIIGWGEEDGIKYWIAANSWGEYWGENGFFRIKRGENNCFIETMVYAGTPDYLDS